MRERGNFGYGVCRQKTRDFCAPCKNEKNGKPCPIKFCHKCLLNRYGQNAEAVVLLGDWKCPKKKQGQLPTGPLYHTAKASGYKCVSEMLAAKVVNKSKDVESNKVNDVAVLASKEATVEKELVVVLSGELGKENTLDVDVEKASSSFKISKKTKRKELKKISNGSNDDGAGKRKSLKRPKICKEVPSEEAKGKANDDTEVCNKVSKEETIDSNHDAARVPMDGLEAWAVDDRCLDINNLLEKAAKGKSFSGTVFGDPASDFVGPVTFAPKVNDDGDNKFQAGMAKLPNVMNWEIEKIKKEIPFPPGTELTEILDIQFPPQDVGSALQLLEFCRVFGKALDLKNGEAEATLRELVRKQSLRRGQKTLVWLETCIMSRKLRSYIEGQNSRHVEEVKETKSKVAAAKEKVAGNKEKGLKQKLQNEMVKAIMSDVAPLSMEEHDALLTKMKGEVAQAHAELLELKGTIPKGKPSSDALRTEPEFLDSNGQAFWKLRIYNGEHAVLLQDIKIGDETATALAPEEKWFVYGPEKKDEWILLVVLDMVLDIGEFAFFIFVKEHDGLKDLKVSRFLSVKQMCRMFLVLGGILFSP
ncbi:Cell division cycle-associated 7-like protein, partial [Mucuna pruriens]